MVTLWPGAGTHELPRYFLAVHKQIVDDDDLLETNPVQYAINNSGQLCIASRFKPKSLEDVESVAKRMRFLKSQAAEPRPGHTSRVCMPIAFVMEQPASAASAVIYLRAPSMDLPSHSVFTPDGVMRRGQPRYAWCSQSSSLEPKGSLSAAMVDPTHVTDSSADHLAVVHAVAVAHLVACSAAEVHHLGVEGIVMPETCLMTISDRPDALMLPLTSQYIPSPDLIDAGLIAPEESLVSRFTHKGDSYRLGIALALMLGAAMPRMSAMGYAPVKLEEALPIPPLVRILIHELTASDPVRRLSMRTAQQRLADAMMLVTMGAPAPSIRTRGTAMSTFVQYTMNAANQTRNLDPVDLTILQSDDLLNQMLQEVRMMTQEQLGLLWQVRFMIVENLPEAPVSEPPASPERTAVLEWPSPSAAFYTPPSITPPPGVLVLRENSVPATGGLRLPSLPAPTSVMEAEPSPPPSDAVPPPPPVPAPPLLGSVLSILPGQDVGGIFRHTMLQAMDMVKTRMFMHHPEHPGGMLMPKFDPNDPALDTNAWTQVGKLVMKCLTARLKIDAPWCSVVYRGILNDTFLAELDDLVEFAPSVAETLMHACFDPKYADHKYQYVLRAPVPNPPRPVPPTGTPRTVQV